MAKGQTMSGNKSADKLKATPIAKEAEPREGRRDQWTCPSCGHVGCPRYSQYVTRSAVLRYRRCARAVCAYTFTTVQAYSAEGKPIGAEELRNERWSGERPNLPR